LPFALGRGLRGGGGPALNKNGTEEFYLGGGG